jgi:hypothetical protein
MRTPTALVVLLLAVASACAVRPAAMTVTHPANADAPVGRLAGAPPALRPGAVTYEDVPAMREGPDEGGGHHHGHK